MRENKELVEVYQDTLEQSAKMNSTGISLKMVNVDSKDIIIENLDTVSALTKYNELSSSVCILNMASPKRPGGGVIKGAIAQEECLFRCSTLGSDIKDTNYPLANNEFIYTSNARFFKDVDYRPMNPISTGVLTIAAIDLSEHRESNGLDSYPKNYFHMMKTKIKSMFETALSYNHETIILGAWGCGVYGNDPVLVSSMFREIIDLHRYRRKFKHIVFAIINDHNSEKNNFQIFKENLER